MIQKLFGKGHDRYTNDLFHKNYSKMITLKQAERINRIYTRELGFAHTVYETPTFGNDVDVKRENKGKPFIKRHVCLRL